MPVSLQGLRRMLWLLLQLMVLALPGAVGLLLILLVTLRHRRPFVVRSNTDARSVFGWHRNNN